MFIWLEDAFAIDNCCLKHKLGGHTSTASTAMMEFAADVSVAGALILCFVVLIQPAGSIAAVTCRPSWFRILKVDMAFGCTAHMGHQQASKSKQILERGRIRNGTKMSTAAAMTTECSNVFRGLA